MSTTKKDKKNSIKNIKIYELCMGGLLMLVIAALFLPQVIFTIQDRYLMTDTEVEVRGSLDVSQLNSLYEKQTHARMSNFISMDIKTATITSIDYDLMEDTDIAEQVKAILRQEWIAPLDTIAVFALDTPIIVQNCKKYIVYGNGYEDGVALMMWYYDVYLDAIDARIRLLVDSETDTIYYVNVTVIGEQYSANVNKSYNYAYSRELLYMMVDRAYYNLDYYYTYYEAGIENFGGLEEKNWGKEDVWYVKMESDDAGYTLHAALPYGELNTDFLLQATYGIDKVIEFTMGVWAIGNMVPEMIQD